MRLNSRPAQSHATGGVILTIGISAGLVAGFNAGLALVIGLGVIAVFMLGRGSGRLALVVFGGWLVLGGTSFAGAKLAYLGLVSIAVLIANVSVVRTGGTLALRHVVLPELLMLAAVSIGALTGLTAGHQLEDILRDAAPYALLAVAGVLALDASFSMNEQRARALLISVGVLSVVGFTASWLVRRGLTQYSLPGFLFSSLTVGAALLAYLSCGIYRRTLKPVWLLLGAAVLALPLLTATRGVLVLALVPVAVLLLALARRQWKTAGRLSILAVGLLAAATLVFLSLSKTGLVDASQVVNRLATAQSAIRSPMTDASLIERATSRELALDTFRSAPVLGAGLGQRFTLWRTTGSGTYAFTLDTSLTTPAKLGIIGSLALLVLMGSWKFLFSSHSLWADVMIVFLIFTSPNLFLGSVFENKGFPIAIMLLLAGSLTAANSQIRPTWRQSPPERAS